MSEGVREGRTSETERPRRADGGGSAGEVVPASLGPAHAGYSRGK